ncbi:MAG TPA: recombinase family protein, partial [Symbiobacteriaceae bacterium]|nr:recombinase family protein [Symbiobacteriaceae bacterium]
WAAVDGLSPYQIARRLEELAVPTRLGGRRWRRSTVAAMLANTTYRGQMRCNRYDTRGLGAVRRLPRSRRRPITATLRPAAEWRVVSVPAIIGEELFQRVQQRLAATVRKGSRPGGRLLSLLVRCGACGGRMAYNLVAGRRLYLKCSRRYADLAGYSDPTRCGSRHQRAQPVEEGVWRTVTAWLLDMALHEAWLAEGAAGAGPPIARLEEQRQVLERQQALVVAKLAQGLLGEPVADALLAETTDQLRQIETVLAEMRAADRASGQAPPASASAALEQTRRHLERLDPAQRQALVRQLAQSVVIHPDGTWTVVPV